ncbi:hypothetical protein GQ44DRAFT_623072, partial [Phaeosphaeriaceae sp. PMI808]
MAEPEASSGSGIRMRTLECNNQFKKCLEHEQLRKHQWLENGRAEFNLWSLGLNASHSGSSSLDWKVRQRPDLQVIITDLLDGLDESLEACLDPEIAVCGDLSPGTTSPENDPNSPLHLSVFNIQSILQQLTKLHIAIRKAGTQLRYQKADVCLPHYQEQNINGLADFRDDMTSAIFQGLEAWDRKNGLPKPWNKANREVVGRLINANIKRRNRILFATKKKRDARAHQKEKNRKALFVANPQASNVEDSKEQPESRKEPEKKDEVAKAGEFTTELRKQPASRHSSYKEESQAPTSASTIPPDIEIEATSSKVAPTTITRATGIAQNQNYPSRPVWPDNLDVKHIDCPYCSEPLTRKQTKTDLAWSGHVSGDLLPYVCFIENCHSPDDLYRTVKELTGHVISEHGVACWICDICTPDTDQDTFDIFQTAQEWRTHLLSAHSQVIADALFSKLAEASTHRMIPPLECPLCDYRTMEIKPNIDPEITRHIHRFSMRALPWETEPEANRSKDHLQGGTSTADTTGSRNRRKNATAVEHMPSSNHDGMTSINFQVVQLQNIELLQRIFLHPILEDKHVNVDRPHRLSRKWNEVLLPILFHIRCNLQDIGDLETLADNNLCKESRSMLIADLVANIQERSSQVSSLLETLHEAERQSLMRKTAGGGTAYIVQWRSLRDQDYIPGDPDYVPLEK